MRFVICDDDEMVTQVLDGALSDAGHELVGVAGTTAEAVELIEQMRPGVAVIDPSVGCNAAFDAIDAAISVGARVVVFSHVDMLVQNGRYEPSPALVLKPDVTALEAVIEGMTQTYPEVDRRSQPTRRFASAGPSDAAAFYAAVNEATEGDAFVSVSATVDGVDAWVGRVSLALRETDLVLRTSAAVLAFMPGAGKEGVHVLHERLINDDAASNEGVMQAVVLEAGESPTDGFARLKDATL
jgi:DNA-binding NarL/FixJ family response regulator